ncbi:restriction endonuclease subunit S [Limosilactobacillus fastidiosus]|uniref:Restriction endonuclease subunit S n=1 Tax=Limosilactobacillus fastidiosus TaxID=2759855 RepID=A0A7W3YCE0_9LACO|nr:restriction endonuclease subunit S [Limosilactobacillus fastidiosus]MCD7084983.1 restriction endonuclease subunit S [Limosilactobacillus fastidiosus]MCD7115322.1 restriction endonuclease subunit S [Limosilactobacillus fastidiosus]MCD7116979.1 restriction endonuclease subunit S [Limosilactobacillus fastidiosus]
MGEVSILEDNKRNPVKASDRVLGKTPYYGANGIQDYVKGYTHTGEHVLVAEDGANNISNYPIYYISEPSWINNHAHVITSNQNLISNLFLAYSLKNVNYLKYLVGSGRYKLNAKILKLIPVSFPSINEQKWIGNVLKKLDDLISLQQRKLDLLKQLKKGLLQKMFADKDTKQPVLRFDGFSGDWEQRKLGTYIIEYNKKTTKNNEYPVLTSSRKGIFFQKDYYDGHQVASKDNVGYNIVPYGYFTYRHMSDDNLFKFNINTLCKFGIVSTLYPVFTLNTSADKYFIYYYLNYGKEMQKFALIQKQGGSRTYMYLSKLRKLRFIVPLLIEQEKISTILLAVDNLLSLQQSKIDKLTLLKKFLLQQMFI